MERPSITRIAIWLTRLSEQQRAMPVKDLVALYETGTGKKATRDAIYRAWREAELPEGTRRGVNSNTQPDRLYHVTKAVLEIAAALDHKLSNEDMLTKFVDKGHRRTNGDDRN